jgi:hypothetical protein
MDRALALNGTRRPVRLLLGHWLISQKFEVSNLVHLAEA